MENPLARFQKIGLLLKDHGPELIYALLILIIGIYLLKWGLRKLRAGIQKLINNTQTVSIIVNSVGVISLALIIVSAAEEIGLEQGRGPLIFGLMIICLISIGIIVIFRPLIPTLPFKVGNTVKAGNILGKVEATTVLNTRLRTFDGKTFFVPNRKILDDIVINYHFTKTRKIMINVVIRYDQDLLEAKRALETVMIEDARVNEKPSPVVYTLNLGAHGVELGARCWVDNKKFWLTKCDLTEKIKYEFDSRGLIFAYPQLDVNHRDPKKDSEIYSTDLEDELMANDQD
ncbi:MAG: mechanosensitive ion channel family protein [Desulfobacteraceae bacterium]|nr:mechanosensitive ion channel family protein [Desulfobacteraceae bacterium]